MNKLYLLGALALSSVDAYFVYGAAMAASDTAAIFQAKAAYTSVIAYGKYVYTASTDCYSTGTATTLGLNNIYHQYYAITIAAGSSTFTTTTLQTVSYGYTGCTHQHLYNWMAQPATTGASSIIGFGTSVVAYGYAMTGTSLTACAATTAALALLSTSIFKGAQYQTITATLTATALAAGAIAAIATATEVWANVGPKYTHTAVGILKAFTIGSLIATSTDAIGVTVAQNSYWDFMQTHVFTGQTQFGRGGGASTSPCGWWVLYFNELPTPELQTDPVTSAAKVAGGAATVHMWTDNSIVSAASAFVLTALAGLLF